MFGIIGGSTSGMFAARYLARKGWPVTVIEPDEAGGTEDFDRTWDEWNRPGVPQLRQPHTMRAYARTTLLREDPELAQDIVDSGVVEWLYKLSGPDIEPAPDPGLVGWIARRPTFESVIRKRVEATPGVIFLRAAVANVLLDTSGPRPRVTGVRLRDGQELSFQCVIDASGRRTRIGDWLREANVETPYEVSQDAGMIYYSRYFRLLPGVGLPKSDGIRSGPAGNIPFVAYRSNTTDRRTFSMLTAVASWEQRFKVLRNNEVFNAFAGSLPGVASWIDPAVSEPISAVHAFGGIYDRYKEFLVDGRPLVQDLYVVGDARVHTSPFFGWGITLGLQHARMLAETFDGAGNEANQVAFEKRANAFSYDYYEAAAGEDAARSAIWRGEPVADPERYGFYVNTLQPATGRDAHVYRAIYRRLNLLDGINEIFSNKPILDRARKAMEGVVRKSLSAEEVMQRLAAAEAAPRCQSEVA